MSIHHERYVTIPEGAGWSRFRMTLDAAEAMRATDLASGVDSCQQRSASPP
jgi:hypothetical protein